MARISLPSAVRATPSWKGPLLEAISKSVPGSVHTEEGKILLVLLSFLSTSENNCMLEVVGGAAPRPRWTAEGNIEESTAVNSGIDRELYEICLSPSTLDLAFEDLRSSRVISMADGAFSVDGVILLCIRDSLPSEQVLFWKTQTFILLYRAIPWKYIEPPMPNISPLLSNLKHYLQAFQDSVHQLSASIRFDLSLTLIEATRFPGLSWKQFAMSQAKAISYGLNDAYLAKRIAQSECIIHRLKGNLNQANNCLNTISNLPRVVNQRLHSSIGQVAIQHALNHMQVEEVSSAEQALESWDSLTEKPSPMEVTILFRKYIVLGRLFRSTSSFTNALTCLQRASKIAEQRQDVYFDEDLRDLTCELADTLRELGEPVSAEDHVRKAMARRGFSMTTLSGGSLVELSLAEALFAQGRLEEAEGFCLNIQARRSLLKLESLRLHVTLAKIRHNSDIQGALTSWSAALAAIAKFTLTGGHATRIILLSIIDLLRSSGQTRLMEDYVRQLNSLEELAKPSGSQSWIPGLRQWSIYLMSKNHSSTL